MVTALAAESRSSDRFGVISAELRHHIEEQDRIGKALRESKEKFRHAAFHDALTDFVEREL